MNSKLLLAALLVSVAVGLSGCKTLEQIVTPSATVLAVEQAAISEATAVVVQSGGSTSAQYAAKAAKISTVAAQVSAAAANPAMTLPLLQAAINTQLVNLKLTPEELAPIQPFVTLLMNFLASKVSTTTGVLTAADLKYVSTVAGWVQAECALFVPAKV